MFESLKTVSPRMKALCFGLTLLSLSCSSEKNKPVEKTQNYGTGEVSRKYQEINGKKEGIMRDFYPDGSLKAERVFENGKQTGRTVIYFPSGKIKETQYYTDGLVHGGDTIWHENGLPRMSIQFQKGQKNGYLHTWDINGKLIFEALYELDSLVEVNGKNIRPGQPAPASKSQQ